MVKSLMNPLSFASCTVSSLGELVRDALSQLGMSEEMLMEFDHHSTVVLGFEHISDIMISVLNDRLWVWSVLNGVGDGIVLQNAVGVLPVLMEPMDNIETSQLTLGKSEEGYELKALVSLQCLSSSDGMALGRIVEDFYKRLEYLHKIIS